MAYTNTYTRINWQNLPSEATALNDVNLNKMDAEIYNHGEEFEVVDTAITNINASLANKVDKEVGKGLSTNDYTTVEKNKLAGIEAGAQVNTVTGVKGNSEGSYRAGNVNITKANIGLGNVDNTSDANKPVSTATQTALNGKVDKVTGKGLSTNDYTTAEKNKLAGIEAQANKTIVDSALSTSSTNPVQNKIITEALREIMPEVTVTGNPISISDGSNIVPAKLAEVTFLPKQSGSGEPSPDNVRPISGWTELNLTRTGKNLLNNTSSSSVISDVTFTVNSDGSVKANGTASAEALFIIPINLPIGNYYASGCADGGSSSLFDVFFYNNTTKARIKQWDGTTNSVSLYDSSTSAQIKIDNTTDVFQYRIRIKNGVNVNNVVFKPMIRLATETDATFEPYVGQNYTETLGSTYYGGKVDLVSGECVIDRGYKLFNGTESWTITGSGSAVISISDMKNVTKTEKNGICSILKTDSSVNGCAQFGGDSATNQFFIIGASSFYGLDTVSKVREFTDGMEISYPLATPIELTLTPQEIELLKGNNVLTSDSNGNIKLTYSADIKAWVESQLSNS